MDLNKFISQLVELRDKSEGNGDLEVVVAADDEGNGFMPIYYQPTLGNFSAYGREFRDEYYEVEKDEDPIVINAVCVN